MKNTQTANKYQKTLPLYYQVTLLDRFQECADDAQPIRKAMMIGVMQELEKNNAPFGYVVPVQRLFPAADPDGGWRVVSGTSKALFNGIVKNLAWKPPVMALAIDGRVLVSGQTIMVGTEEMIYVDCVEPRSSASTGRCIIMVKGGQAREYYPSVIGAEWVEIQPAATATATLSKI